MAAIATHIVIKEMAAEPRPRINFVILVFPISASLVSGCTKILGRCRLIDCESSTGVESFTPRKEKDRCIYYTYRKRF